MNIVDKLEAQSLQNIEMQLNISTIMDRVEHDNNAMVIHVKELEEPKPAEQG